LQHAALRCRRAKADKILSVEVALLPDVLVDLVAVLVRHYLDTEGFEKFAIRKFQ